MDFSTHALELLADSPLPLLSNELPVEDLLDHSILPSLDSPPSPREVGFPLSHLPPQVDPDALRLRPVPTASVIDATVRLIKNASSGPVRSMLDWRYDPPLPTPLGMIRYWLRITSAIQGRRVWSNVRELLVRLLAVHAPAGGRDFQDLTAAWTTLSALPWHYQLCVRPSIHSRDLLAILSGEPLKRGLVDTLLGMLRRELREQRPLIASNVSVLTLGLQDILMRVFGGNDDVVLDGGSPDHMLLQALASPLMKSEPVKAKRRND